MSNKLAKFAVSLIYSGLDDETVTSPPLAISAPFSPGASQVGGIDIPDLAAEGTEYPVAFGSIAAATGLLIENRSGQDLSVKLNGEPGSVAGTLVACTKTMALAAVTGERLSAELVTSHGTPGILSARRSAGNVIVESWLAGTGLQALDISDVKVWQGGSPYLFRLPTGAAIVIAMPAAAGATPIASASVVLSGIQAGAGSVVTKVFGDPVTP
jgi:hypothetical protein